MQRFLAILVFCLIFVVKFSSSADLGGNCNSDVDCSSTVSVCTEGTCQCDENHVEDGLGEKCVVENGKPCDARDTCEDIYASCQKLDPDDMFNTTSLCLCKEHYVIKPGTNVCAGQIGEMCNNTAVSCAAGECVEQENETNEDGEKVSRCVCQDGLLPNSDRSQCLPALNANCETNEGCADPNALCDTTCKCLPQFEEVQRNDIGVCLKRVLHPCTFGEKCADNNAKCVEIVRGLRTAKSNNKCWCKPGHVINKALKKCLPVADHFEAACEEDIQCIGFLGHAGRCLSTKCACKSGYEYNIDEIKCVAQ